MQNLRSTNMMVQKENKLKSLSAAVAFGGLLLVAMGCAYLFLTPKSYRATARLKVTAWINARDPNGLSDSSVVPAECQVLRSAAVMDQVIANLGLKEKWGQRYALGATTTTGQVRDVLRSKAIIQPNAKSSLITIQVTSEIPEETASIANEFARVYTENHQVQRQDLIRKQMGTFKQQWNDTSQKLQDAIAAQTKLYFEISKTRQTSQWQFYDADTFDLLLQSRDKVEGDYAVEQAQLAELKKMNLEQRKQVLASLDGNSILASALNELNKAKANHISVSSDHGPDSKEVKAASQIMADLSGRIDSLAASAMTMRETKLDGLKANLDELDQKLKHATTNISQVAIQDERYTKVSEQVKSLRQERDDLQAKMDADESVVDAVTPTSVTTEIIDTGEVPGKPFIPDRKMAIAIMSTGGGAILLSCLLILLGQMPKPEARKLRAI